MYKFICLRTVIKAHGQCTEKEESRSGDGKVAGALLQLVYSKDLDI